LKYKILLSLALTTTLFSAPENELNSVRGILGSFNPVEHTDLQVRMGYISLNKNEGVDSSSFAVGGHVHLDTKRYYGMKIDTSFYTVQGLGMQDDNPFKVNPDFFDANLESFSLISKAYIDGEWGNTNLKVGRHSLDTPHADADDIRMMPNYFEAYEIENSDIENLTLQAGLITKMAGWENGVDSSEFVKISDILGTDQTTDGVYFASAVYEGIDDLSLSAWYYNYDDIADIFYGEIGYNYNINENIEVSLGVQYDTSTASGDELLGEQSSDTFGAIANLDFKDIGVKALLAYNQESDESGATGLSLGGGAFFTSMEDQTIDALGSDGTALLAGMSYQFSTIGFDGLVGGFAYGMFEAEDSEQYETAELDLVMEYTVNDKISVVMAYSDIDDKTDSDEDYNQLRVLANYNF
jgi:hypothetical protein